MDVAISYVKKLDSIDQSIIQSSSVDEIKELIEEKDELSKKLLKYAKSNEINLKQKLDTVEKEV